MTGVLLSTPFHARTAEHNLANAWATRRSFAVPAHYGDPLQEALAPHLTAAMIDVSANQDLRIAGPGAAALLSAACGAPLRGMSVGHSEEVHWCADGGGLRGLGVVSRLGEQDFLLRSTDADLGWFASAAPRFGATVRDATRERGLLLLTGPYAIAVMVAARLEISHLEPNRHARYDWRGAGVTVFRCARLGGYELSCAADDGMLVFDRLFRGGRLVDLRLAGEETLQLLQLEAGMVLPYADFVPARDPFARTPSPAALGLPDLRGDGGRREGPVLAGIELESDEPAPFAPVFAAGREAGRTLRSLYSPALKGAIALAELSPANASPGTLVQVRRAEGSRTGEVGGRVRALPFL